MASSKELVCKLWVPPNTAAMASMVVRTTLFMGSCSVSDTPLVWQCVRNMSDPVFCGLNSLTMRAHSRRAARSLATSMKKFIPMQKKKLRRPANSSIPRPAAMAARAYSRPSASVNANSCTALAPASCMW